MAKSNPSSIALVNNHIRIVQASILGSILVNLLLILGSALLASNLANYESILDEAESHLLAGLLFVSVFVILMPVSLTPLFVVCSPTDPDRRLLTTPSIAREPPMLQLSA
ncbi:hypothetical protein AUP68_13694 [Ilyonectria robusta]